MPNEVQVSIGAKLTGAFKRVFKDASSSVTSLEKKLAKLEAASVAGTKLANLQRVTKKLKSEFDKTGRSSTALKNKLTKSAMAMGKAHLEAKKLGIDTSRLSMENDRLSQSLRRVRGEQERLNRSRKRSASINNFAGGAAAAGGAALGAGAAGIFGLQSFLGPAIDFEASIAELKARGGLTKKQTNELSDVLRDRAAKSVFTSKQVGEAAVSLIKADFSVDDIKTSLKPILDLASGERVSIDFAAEFSANVLKQFELSAEEIPRVVNLLSKAASISTVDLSDMAESMKFLGTTAKQLKIPLEDSANLIAILGNAGLKGGIATRAFKTSLFRLADPTTGMTKAMAKFNEETGKFIDISSFFTEEGEFKGLKNLIGVIKEATQDVDTKAGIGLVAGLFGGEAAVPILGAIKKGAFGFEQGIQALNKAVEENAVGVLAAEQINTVSGATKILVSALQELANTIFFEGSFGSGFKKVIQDVTSSITKLATIIKNNPVLSTLAGTFASLIGVGSALLIIFGGLALLVASLGFTFNNLAIAGKFAFNIFKSLPLVIEGVTAALSTLGGPVVWGIVAAAFLIWKFWKPIAAFFGGLLKGVLSGLEPIFKSLGISMGELGDMFGELFGQMEFSPQTLKSIEEFGARVGEIIGSTITLLAKLVTGFKAARTVSVGSLLKNIFFGSKIPDPVSDYKLAVKNSALPKYSVGGDKDFTPLTPSEFPRATAPSNTTNNTVSPSIVINAAPGMNESLIADLVAKKIEDISFSSAVQERGEF